MADHPDGLRALPQCQALFIVCSTQGDGVPPSEARDFCAWLLHPDQHHALESTTSTSTTWFSVCALGDRSYTHFARCGKTLDARLEGVGGRRLVPRADINKEDWNAIDEWIGSVVRGLEWMEGEGELRTARELEWYGVGNRAEEDGDGDGDGDGEHMVDAKKKKYTKSRPYYATVVAVESLCAPVHDITHDKNTVRVEIDLGTSGLRYAPGDALGVWPTNDSSLVVDVMDALEDGDEKMMVKRPAWHYDDTGATDATQNNKTERTMMMPLRQALMECYDLKTPKLDLLKLLKDKLTKKIDGGGFHYDDDDDNNNNNRNNNNNGTALCSENEEDATHKNGYVGAKPTTPTSMIRCLCDEANGLCIADLIDRLSNLVNDNAKRNAYLASRHVTDILHDWRPATLTTSELLSSLRQLAPRLYSISSSPLDAPHRVQITVAVVRYHSLGALRAGVASTQLGERAAPGHQVPVYIYPNEDFRLPESGDVPMIMVGPGTGIAPFRAFITHRLLLSEQQQEGDININKEMVTSDNSSNHKEATMMLFFGSRRRDEDYLYGDLLEGWAHQGAIQLYTAFSRQGPHKVYVQHRILEQKDRVFAALQRGGMLYVCGDGAHMAADVEAAVMEVLVEKLGGREAAEKYWKEELVGGGDGKKKGRYRKDVWVS